MASKSCRVVPVSFKTRRGRRVRFMSRPGGKEECGPRKLKEGERSARRTFKARKYHLLGAKASKHCAGKGGKAFQSCRRAYIKAHAE